MSNADDIDKMNRNTAKYRILPSILNSVSNLRYVDRLAPITAQGRFLEGVPAVIVGAGPSLDRNIDALKEIASHVCIFANGSSLPALRKANIQADYTFNIESIMYGSDEQFDGGGVPVTSPTTNTNVVNLAARRFGCYLSPAYPYLLPTWYHLDVPPLCYGGFVTSACVATAVHLGASPIMLVGMDCSYDLDSQKAYASGARWGGIVAKDGGDIIAFENQEERNAEFKLVGVPGVTPTRRCYELDGWKGKGKVKTTIELLSQTLWFANYAKANGARVPLFNCTEGGAHLDGWEDASLFAAMALDWGQREVPDVRYTFTSALKQETAIRALKKEAVDATRQLGMFGKAEKFMHNLVMTSAQGWPMVSAIALADHLLIEDMPIWNSFYREKLAASYSVGYEAAKKLDAIISEVAIDCGVEL